MFNPYIVSNCLFLHIWFQIISLIFNLRSIDRSIDKKIEIINYLESFINEFLTIQSIYQLIDP
jgi:hypothetical protein